MPKNTKPKPRRPAPAATHPDPRAARAAMLDRLADAELQQGHIAAAEVLAWRAAALREAAQ